MADVNVARQWARKAGLGRAAYLGWHAPRAFVRRCRTEGAMNLFLADRGRRRMEAFARTLPPVTAAADAPAVHLLTGRKFAEQTILCAWTLAVHASSGCRFVFVDDGTLQHDQHETFRRIFPDGIIKAPDRTHADLDRLLPRSRYPATRALREVYPHLRKLTDVHADRTGWKLVLDSDMLFHGRPDWLLAWLAAPRVPCCMVDVDDAYGYSPALMRELAGGAYPSRVNVGLCGLDGAAIDWDRLERWIDTMIQQEGRHYLQEQALTALLMAGGDVAYAPLADYVVSPTREETQRPKAVLHHYTATSKAWYFRHGWRHVERLAAARAGREAS